MDYNQPNIIQTAVSMTIFTQLSILCQATLISLPGHYPAIVQAFR